ncbi:hypothetical protein AX16_010698 [Volvariella volvacea WC 439]|nr:hypothetical protein AX16_010698 [Volvariella volvacea WC 439]
MANYSTDKDLAYDPDQNPEEKRAVRKHYRDLTRIVEGNINDLSVDQIRSNLDQADDLFNKVKGPQEATLDSHLLRMASHLSAQKARALKNLGGGFDVDEFLSKLVSFMDVRKHSHNRTVEGYEGDEDVELDWDKIGRRILTKSRRVPALGFMLGPLSIEQKKRATGKRAKFEKNKEDERKPQEIREEDISRTPNETTKNVAILEQLLQDELEPINIFRFVINPHDFAQSVENIFHLSFLIRDGKVSLEIDEMGEPLIMLCEQPSDQDYEGGLKKRQMVLEFDMAIWKRAIEVFNITEPKIPARPKAQTRIGDKWYG